MVWLVLILVSVYAYWTSFHCFIHAGDHRNSYCDEHKRGYSADFSDKIWLKHKCTDFWFCRCRKISMFEAIVYEKGIMKFIMMMVIVSYVANLLDASTWIVDIPYVIHVSKVLGFHLVNMKSFTSMFYFCCFSLNWWAAGRSKFLMFVCPIILCYTGKNIIVYVVLVSNSVE